MPRAKELLNKCRNHQKGGLIHKKCSCSTIESTPATLQVWRSVAQPQPEASMASALTEMLVELEDSNEADLEAIQKIYKNFGWNAKGATSLR